ncbi:MAG: hypothetical protein J7K48_03880 [Thermococcus sp.]|nr:hypothetical protein [Thermococcus sp.]
MEAVQVEEIPQIEDFEEENTGQAEGAGKVAFAQPSVLTSMTKEQMEQAAGEVAMMASQGYDEQEIQEYVQQKYGLEPQAAALTVQTLMQYLQKRHEERTEMQKQALGMLPTLAQSDNPFAGLVMQSLIEKAGLKEEESFTRELIEMQKELMKAKLATEMMKEMNLGGSSNYDPLMVELIKGIREEAKEKEQMLYQLLLERLQSNDDEKFAQMMEIMRQSIEALNQKIEATMMSAGRSEMVEPVHKDTVDEATEFAEKLEKLRAVMEALGYKVQPPGAQENDPLKQFEMQMKLKELELKEKEIENQKVLYEKVAEAISNPQFIQSVLGFLGQLLGRGPAPGAMQVAMTQAAQVPAQPVEAPDDLPSLDDFVGGEDG